MRAIFVVIVISVSLIIWWLSTPKNLVSNNTASQQPVINEMSSDSLSIQPQTLSNSNKIHRENSSLKGTEIDGMYPVDADGKLIFSKSIKYRFLHDLI